MSASRSNRLSGVVWLSRSRRPRISPFISGSASSRRTLESRSRLSRPSSSLWTRPLRSWYSRDLMSAVCCNDGAPKRLVMNWSPPMNSCGTRKRLRGPRIFFFFRVFFCFFDSGQRTRKLGQRASELVVIFDGDGYSLVQRLKRASVVTGKAVFDWRPYGTLDIFVTDVRQAILTAHDHGDFVLPVALPHRRGDPAGASHRRQLLVRDHDDARHRFEPVEHRRIRARHVEDDVTVVAFCRLENHPDPTDVNGSQHHAIGGRQKVDAALGAHDQVLEVGFVQAVRVLERVDD